MLSAFIHEPATNFWFEGNPDTGRTICSSSGLSWSDTIQRDVIGRQLHAITDQLPSHNKNVWFDLENGTNLGGKESRTGMSALHRAASKGHDLAVFVLLSSASATVATSWNNANNKNLVRSEHRVVETGRHTGVRDTMVRNGSQLTRRPVSPAYVESEPD